VTGFGGPGPAAPSPAAWILPRTFPYARPAAGETAPRLVLTDPRTAPGHRVPPPALPARMRPPWSWWATCGAGGPRAAGRQASAAWQAPPRAPLSPSSSAPGRCHRARAPIVREADAEHRVPRRPDDTPAGSRDYLGPVSSRPYILGGMARLAPLTRDCAGGAGGSPTGCGCGVWAPRATAPRSPSRSRLGMRAAEEALRLVRRGEDAARPAPPDRPAAELSPRQGLSLGSYALRTEHLLEGCMVLIALLGRAGARLDYPSALPPSASPPCSVSPTYGRVSARFLDPDAYSTVIVHGPPAAP
jgi:hypothetical protein